MQQTLPVIIGRSWAGLVGISLTALLAISLVAFGFWSMMNVPYADLDILFLFGVLSIALIASFFIVWIHVYSLSYIELTTDGVIAVHWKSLFAKEDVRAEWFRIQDVSAVRANFFAQMLNFGNLNIQTAGTLQNIRMTMVPNVEHWQQVIADYADQATT